MSFSKYSFRNLLDEFTKIEEDDIGGEPLTSASVGLPQKGDDAFIGKTYSNLEGATKGYAYDHSSKKKKKWKLGKSFMDHILKRGSIAEEAE